MSRKGSKGQTAKGHKSIWEAKYGSFADDDLIKQFLDLRERLLSTEGMLGIINFLIDNPLPRNLISRVPRKTLGKQPLYQGGGDDPTQEQVDAKRHELQELRNELGILMVSISKRTKAQGAFDEIAKQDADSRGKTYAESAQYRAGFAVFTMYRCGERNYQELHSLTLEIEPQMTKHTFSKMLRQYEINDLVGHKKRGPAPGTKYKKSRPDPASKS